MRDKSDYLKSIKNGTHRQFLYNEEKEKVVCKCGHTAAWLRNDFLCGTITACPCKWS
tara:strand:+ start:664 stop:834 length:171 start_codon:yes stop_codon:yes gene_type:complete